jgi:hypothetical protein
MGEMKNSWGISVVKPEMMRQLGRLSRGWRIRMDLKKREFRMLTRFI